MSVTRPWPGNRSRPRFVVGCWLWWCCVVLLVAPRVFRAPEGPAAREARRPHFVRCRASKPARALRSLRRPPHQWGLVCSWAAARPRDRHTRACGSEWSISRPALALPPPTGTAARPRHRPPAPRPAREPSAPRVSLGASTRCPAWPRSYLSNFARNSPAACSNIEFTSLELQRFRMVLKSDRGKLCATLVSAGPPATFCAAAGPASRSPPMPSGALLWCARCGEEALFWIGTALLDSLLTYPERNNLSRLLFPIQFGGVCQPGGLLAAWQWGVLRHAKPSGGASPACRRLGWRNSPVWCSTCMTVRTVMGLVLLNSSEQWC